MWVEILWWSLGDFGGLRRHQRRVGKTRVAVGEIQTRLSILRGSVLGSGGLSSEADAGVAELGQCSGERESMVVGVMLYLGRGG